MTIDRAEWKLIFILVIAVTVLVVFGTPAHQSYSERKLHNQARMAAFLAGQTTQEYMASKAEENRRK